MPKAKQARKVEAADLSPVDAMIAEDAEPQHIETEAEEYRRLKNEAFDRFIDESFTKEALAEAKTETVQSPDTRKKWVIRRLDQKFFSAAGTMPMHLANKVRGVNGEVDAAAVQNLTQAEHDRLMELSWRSLFYGCIKPRIVITPSASSHIAIDDVVTGDFEFLTQALLKGGKEAERLYTFRRKR